MKVAELLRWASSLPSYSRQEFFEMFGIQHLGRKALCFHDPCPTTGIKSKFVFGKAKPRIWQTGIVMNWVRGDDC